VDNVLYAANADIGLWAYDDLLTSPPVLVRPAVDATVNVNPATGLAEPIILVWLLTGAGSGAANRVDVQFRVLGEPAWITAADIGVPPATPQVVMTPTVAPFAAFPGLPGVTYQWRVRWDNQISGDVVRSPWSEIRSFTVVPGVPVEAPHVGPILLGPTPDARDVPLRPSFSWTPVYGATEYEVILSTDHTLITRILPTPVLVTRPAWTMPDDLEHGTTYFWAVRVTHPALGPQSIGTFTTIEEPVEPPLPPPTPAWVWVMITIGAVLVIVIVVLIFRTRRV
jgi:hypothetical protein